MPKPRTSMLAKLRAGTIRPKGHKVRERLAEALVRRPQEVPAALLGKYVAWSSDGLVILGAGDTVAEARAQASGDPRPDHRVDSGRGRTPRHFPPSAD